jgi:hypothetical protein
MNERLNNLFKNLRINSMGTTQSTSYINTLNNPANVQLQQVQAYIQKFSENFNYMTIYYVENSQDLIEKNAFLEKTDHDQYNRALDCLEHNFVNAIPMNMYIHPQTRRIYRIVDDSGMTIDILPVDALDMHDNLYVNQRNKGI